MKHLKLFFIFFTVVLTVSIVAQTENSPSRTPQKFNYQTIEAIWDVELNFDVTAASGAAGNAGAEYDGTYFYSTRWATNLIHKYSNTGALVEEFSIAGVTGLRDLAFDGTYMYGGAAANTIYKMDFVTKTLVGTITSPVAVRNIAYDAANDAFWVGNWATDLVLVSRTGATLATIPAATHGFAGMYGTDVDNVSPGGPYLWVFDQGGGAGLPQIIHQLALPSGVPTGVTHDVITDIGSGNTSAIAGGLFGMSNFVPGKYSLGGLLQGTPDEMFVYEIASTGPPCPVGQPTNLLPANNSVDLPINGVQLSWTNPATANSNELYFGTDPGSLTMVQQGTQSSYNVPGPLTYFTTYYWRLKEKNDTCFNWGPLTNFRTIQDPNLFFAVNDDFSSGTGLWTITNDGGTCLWEIRSEPYPNAYTLPPTSVSPIFTADVDECGSGTTLMSTATLTNGVNFSVYQTVNLEFDSDWNAIDAQDSALVDVSNDGGTTWVRYMSYGGTDMRNEHKVIDVSATAALHNNVKIRFVSQQPGWDWWWVIDNVKLIGSNVIPVELVSFQANVFGKSVELSWATATETNNSGFEVERSLNGREFAKIGFVAGNGTSTQTHTYNFTDTKLETGNYTYRLKQIDMNGDFKYSSTVSAVVSTPAVYSLEQNYPNPFNPNTKISFSLALDSKVSLKIFDILGQEVAQLVNSNMPAGEHSVNFDASYLNSGVYIYKIEAKGLDGTNFVSVKKMVLTK